MGDEPAAEHLVRVTAEAHAALTTAAKERRMKMSELASELILDGIEHLTPVPPLTSR